MRNKTFSEANRKLKNLERIRRKKVYSFSLLAGYCCPFAKDCKSQVIKTKDGLRIKDSPQTKFRCYMASVESRYLNVFNQHKKNSQIVRLSKQKIVEKILSTIPIDANIIRIHTGGDFTSQKYFDAWLEVAKIRDDLIFYTYTKSLLYWVRRIKEIPPNLILTASKGGKLDYLIEQHQLRYAEVVMSKEEAKQKKLHLEINERVVSSPKYKKVNVALLIHGIQPKGEMATIVYNLRKNKGK